MEQRLDERLSRTDRYAAEDGEAKRHSYCWAGRHYVPWEDMPPLPAMMCNECQERIKDFDVDAFIEDCEARIERLEHSKRHANRVTGVSEVAQRTFDATFEGTNE